MSWQELRVFGGLELTAECSPDAVCHLPCPPQLVKANPKLLQVCWTARLAQLLGKHRLTFICSVGILFMTVKQTAVHVENVAFRSQVSHLFILPT